MSILTLLFPTCGAAHSLGAAPEERPSIPARHETASAPFSQWLQRAQPAAPSPQPSAAPSGVQRSAATAADTDGPPSAERQTPASQEAHADAANTAADDPQDKDLQTHTPAGSDGPGAWWLSLPLPAAPVSNADAAASGAQPLQIDSKTPVLVDDPRASYGHDTASKALSGDPPDTASGLQPELATDPTPTLAELGEAQASAALVPASATSAGSRAGEGAATAPVLWGVGASAAAATSGPSVAGTSAAVSHQSLATRVQDPDFPETLAHSVTVLARQGIQEAKLHLNPAEMGSVSVYITVSGQQAQVDFAASASATRAALEASLSHLASALHSAGLTLTGGGVSPEPPPRRSVPDASSGSPRQARSDADESLSTAAVALPPTRAGRLDLYA
jgi:flagellar hook-length control protein FliK